FHTMDFTYTISNKGTYAIVEMSGNLIDKNQASPLLDEIQDMITKGINSFVISMESFRYLNSNGLNVLVNILTKSRKNGGDTTICCISDKIKELLIITKLNTVFTITDDLPAAVKQFQN
ncbi:MAG TPA: STAS domain-containing protein, partial [Bacteroidia bacterium]|nr:STAS domain-containing protein [Bacteroidia bacterium]